MTAPRPSRGARWGIGLAVAGVLLLVGVVGGGVAIGQAASSGAECVTDPGAPGLFCPDSSYTARATATVTRSQANTDPFFGDSADAPGWFVDVAFQTEDGERVEAYDIAWPQGTSQPGEGSLVLVAYDPADPEFSVTAASALDAAKADAEPAEASPAALWTTGVGFAAALAALAGTVVWARRAPRRERPAPAGWYAPGYGYPPPGYGYPPPGYGYPPPGYAQPGYPQQQGYPPPGYAPPGYAPPGYGPPQPAPPPPSAPPPSGPPVTPPQPGGWNTPG